MRRLRSLRPLLVVSAVLLPACLVPPEQADPPSPAPPSFPLTLTDDAGFDLELQEVPERVLALGEGMADILEVLEVELLTLGAESPGEAEIRSLNPDLVLQQAGPGPLGELERDPSIPLFILTTATFDDLLHDVVTIGRLTGKNAEAEELAVTMAERAGDVRQRTEEVEAVTCVLELGFDQGVVDAKPGTFDHDLLVHAGCEPVEFVGAVSTGDMVLADPDVYLIGWDTTVEAVGNRRDYVALTAFQVDRAHLIDPELLLPGPRAADGLLAIADALYPESADEEEDDEDPTPTGSG